MSEGFVSTTGLSAEVTGPRVTLTIDRPRQRNALDDTSMAAFIDNLEAAATDDGLRVIVVRGANQNFCSGFDIVGRNAVREVKPRTASIQRRRLGFADRR